MTDHSSQRQTPFPPHIERGLAVPMRDGTILRADLWLPCPAPAEPRPVLICRTPYGRAADPDELRFANAAVARGYAVLMQDVRGRHDSEGDFEPHVNEGRDGHDSIEWAAAQGWCDGRAGTFGLSYPGCAQWLAALEAPPHLLALAPAMSHARLREAIRYGGVFDADWVRWASLSTAPEHRRRHGLPGPQTEAEAWEEWQRLGEDAFLGHLPLAEVADLRDAAPFFIQWLARPQHSLWWNFGDVAERLGGVTAAVLHLDGWLDDACGPKGAIANHLGLCAARADEPEPRSRLILGPWGHGVPAITGRRGPGGRGFGPLAFLDYDALVLDFMDRHVRGLRTAQDQTPRVRYFVMGENQWREADAWPPHTRELCLHLHAVGKDGLGGLSEAPPAQARESTFVNDPARPVREISAWTQGPADQRALLETERGRLLAFETGPLAEALCVAGNIRAELWVSLDAPDADLCLLLQDVAPDGAAYALMDPRAGALRLSSTGGPLAPGEVRRVSIGTLLTANTFLKGHRLRLVVCASWHPALARNLQTGEDEAFSSASRPARITLHHGPQHQSRLLLPIASPARAMP